MKKPAIVLFAAILLAGCGGGSSSWAVKYKGKDLKFDKFVGNANFRPDLQQGQIVISNFEPEIKNESVMGIPDSEKAGEAFVGIYFKTNNQADYKNSVKPGDVSDGITSLWISSGDDKQRVSFAEGGKVTGKLEITEVTDTVIKGKINVTKGDSSVSGPFEAKIIKKTP
ncbi:MAG TPA: hypothetical protein PKA82_13890 [Pyrinomonadaceae bacterium]|nr:hypothetical protein [Pyrinomonadaceae bacterium]